MDLTYRDALRIGLRNVLQNQPKSFLIGEDVGAYGGTYAVSKDFLFELLHNQYKQKLGQLDLDP